MIGAATTINTAAAVPTITTSGVTNNGTIYGGPSVDGLAAPFLFGSEIAGDAMYHFDSRFGVNYLATTPPNGVAVYKFAAIQFTGAPIVQTTGGPIDLAFIGQAGISAGGAGGTWNVSNLRSVFIGSENGTVSLSNKIKISATAGSAFQFLHVYGRTTTTTGGNATLGGTYTLPTAKLFVDSMNNAVLANTATANVDHALFNATNNVQIAGSLTANFAQLWAGSAITVNGSINATTLYTHSATMSVGGSITGQTLNLETSSDFGAGVLGTFIKGTDVTVKVGGILPLNTSSSVAATQFDLSGATSFRASAGTINLLSDFAMPSGGTALLVAGAGGITGGFNVTNVDTLEIDGGSGSVNNLDAKTVNVTNSGNLTVTGNLNVTNAYVSGALNVTQTISPRVGDALSLSHTISAGSVKAGGGLNFNGQSASALLTSNGGGASSLTLLSNSVLFDATGINGATFNGGDGTSLVGSTGGDGGTFNVGTSAQPIAGTITVNKPISATTGANDGALGSTGGNGGTVNMVANDTITVNSSIKVSESSGTKASAKGGNISLTSNKTSGVAISVTSSGQLLSLLANAAPGPGGTIKFTSAGGDINVNGGTVQADRGTVHIQNNGSGAVNLTNANLSADVVKVGALGSNGQLVVNGGSISANTAIKLYANGSNGQVLFNGDVALNGNSVKTIAGDTVTIANGKIVTINGSQAANVFTNKANYTGSGGNGSTSGKFGGAGATTSPMSGAPAF